MRNFIFWAKEKKLGAEKTLIEFMDLFGIYLFLQMHITFESTFLLLFITPWKSKMHMSVSHHRCDEWENGISNQNFPTRLGLLFSAAYSIFLRYETTCTLFRVDAFIWGNFHLAVSLCSHRGIEEMVKVFVRK